MQVVQGLVRPEDMPEPEAGTANGTGSGSDPARVPGGSDGASGRIDAPAVAGPASAPADPEAKARKEAGVGIGLADDLRAVRTGIVKAKLACDFDAAFDLMLFQLAHAVFGTGYRDDALDVAVRPTPEQPQMRANDESFLSVNVGEKLLAIDRADLPLGWLGKPAAEAFAGMRRLPEREKRQLFASCVARTLKGQLAFEAGARPETEATVARLDVDFAAAVRANPAPVWTAGLLWSRLRKDRLLAIARATLGEAWAAAHAKGRKTEIAAALEAAFDAHGAAPAEVAAEGRAAALAGVPPGFAAFDAGGAENGEDGPEAEPAPADEVPERPVDDVPGAGGGDEPSDPRYVRRHRQHRRERCRIGGRAAGPRRGARHHRGRRQRGSRRARAGVCAGHRQTAATPARTCRRSPPSCAARRRRRFTRRHAPRRSTAVVRRRRGAFLSILHREMSP